MLSYLTFKSLSHFEFIFVYSERVCSKVFFFLIDLFIYLFILGCVGSSLLCTGFL